MNNVVCPKHMVEHDENISCPLCWQENVGPRRLETPEAVAGAITITLNEHAPKGVTPRAEWDAQRRRNLLNACKRYSEAKWAVPIEWLEELEELTK